MARLADDEIERLKRELLREGLAASAGAAAGPVKRSTVRKLPPPVQLEAEDQELLQQVVGYYHDAF